MHYISVINHNGRVLARGTEDNFSSMVAYAYQLVYRRLDYDVTIRNCNRTIAGFYLKKDFSVGCFRGSEALELIDAEMRRKAGV